MMFWVLLSVAAALDNGLGRLPVRGVSSWCVQGECGWDRCWDAQYRALADAMVETGLLAAGYEYLNIDDCWVAGRNETTKELFPDPTRFPHGMANLAEYVHSKGLKIGIYTDATTQPCVHGQYDREHSKVPGSWGHYDQDAFTFAKWGYDYVKMDFCTTHLPNGTLIDAEAAYTAFSHSLNKTGRPIYFMVCYDHWLNRTSGKANHGMKPVWEWVHPVANSYRLSYDHHDDWSQLAWELEANANAGQHSQAGSFGSFDFVSTGGQGCVVGPRPPEGPAGGGAPGLRCPNMTEHEYQTAFSLWVIGGSPLIVDADVRNMSSFQRRTLMHSEMLGIHHDARAVGGSRIGCALAEGRGGVGAGPCEGGQVWAKPLKGNETAVALFNSKAQEQALGFDFSLLGYGASTSLVVRDVWSQTDLGVHRGSFVLPYKLAAHATAVLRVAGA